MSYRSRKAYKHKAKSAITLTFTIPSGFIQFTRKTGEFFVIYRYLFVGLLLFAAVFFFSFPYFYTHVLYAPKASTNVLTQKGPIQINTQLLGRKIPQDPPTRIVIPSLSIDLRVVEAPVINGYWETSDTSASHGVGSAVPGQNGNMVIFAHARQGLFLPLRNITKGATIYVMTKNKWYQYKVRETKLVDPTQTEVISPTKDQTLTLYTCDGYFDEKRFIVVAKPL